MISHKQELIASLKKLVFELEKSEKFDTSKFFKGIAEQLEGDVDVAEALDKIVHSGSITQYANFSSSEDLVYGEAHKYAVELKGLYSKGTE